MVPVPKLWSDKVRRRADTMETSYTDSEPFTTLNDRSVRIARRLRDAVLKESRPS